MSKAAVAVYYATITTIIAGIIALTLYAGLTRNSSRDWFPDDRQRVMGTEYGESGMTGAAGTSFQVRSSCRRLPERHEKGIRNGKNSKIDCHNRRKSTSGGLYRIGLSTS